MKEHGLKTELRAITCQKNAATPQARINESSCIDISSSLKTLPKDEVDGPQIIIEVELISKLTQ